MINNRIVVYDIPLHSFLELTIKDDCISLYSEVRINDDGDTSEATYSLSKEETKKLLNIMSLDAFIDLVRTVKVKGMLDFFKKENIKITL